MKVSSAVTSFFREQAQTMLDLGTLAVMEAHDLATRVVQPVKNNPRKAAGAAGLAAVAIAGPTVGLDIVLPLLGSYVGSRVGWRKGKEASYNTKEKATSAAVGGLMGLAAGLATAAVIQAGIDNNIRSQQVRLRQEAVDKVGNGAFEAPIHKTIPAPSLTSWWNGTSYSGCVERTTGAIPGMLAGDTLVTISENKSAACDNKYPSKNALLVPEAADGKGLREAQVGNLLIMTYRPASSSPPVSSSAAAARPQFALSMPVSPVAP